MKKFVTIKNDGLSISLNLTSEQIKEIINRYGTATSLKDIAVGETVMIGEYEFIVLEHSKDTTSVILKDFLEISHRFGEDNNYDGSFVDDICIHFANNIAQFVGKHNLIEHTVNLTADDGLKCYGSVKRKASLLTADLYRRYVDILDKYNLKKWWWLATPYSTPKHGDSSCIKCVTPSGCVGYYFYDYEGGVRPFLIFDSSIFVSKGETI